MYKSILAVISILFTSEVLSAQGAVLEENKPGGVLAYIMDNFVLFLGVIIVLWALLAMWRMLNMMMDIQKMKLMKELGADVVKEANFRERKSIWKSWHEKAWSLVPIQEEGTIDLGHDYDGIRELDNKLPPWWLALFYGTVIFGMGYWYYYEMSDRGMGQEKRYAYEIAQAEIAQEAFLAKQANAIDEKSVVRLEDPALLKKGEAIFKANCVACHGPDGQGTVGPNFTDEYWIHGGGINNIFKTIKYGVPSKGMISWKTQLNPAAMQQVASYIMSLEGTNPPNPKPPEGEIWKPKEE